MPSEKDILRRALGRLGRVPPEALGFSRQRFRENLRIDPRLTTRLPSPDATPADLTPLRRPFYIGGAMALVCLLIAGGVVVRWRFDSRSASTLAAKSGLTRLYTHKRSDLLAGRPNFCSVFRTTPACEDAVESRRRRVRRKCLSSNPSLRSVLVPHAPLIGFEVPNVWPV